MAIRSEMRPQRDKIGRRERASALGGCQRPLVRVERGVPAFG